MTQHIRDTITTISSFVFNARDLREDELSDLTDDLSTLFQARFYDDKTAFFDVLRIRTETAQREDLFFDGPYVRIFMSKDATVCIDSCDRPHENEVEFEAQDLQEFVSEVLGERERSAQRPCA